MTPKLTVRRSGDLPERASIRVALQRGLMNGVQAVKRRAEERFAATARQSRIGPALKIDVRRNGQEITLATTNFHARFLEHGTVAHAILPRRGNLGSRALRNAQRRGETLPRALKIPAAGGTIFRQFAHRGDQPARPWLGPVVLQTGKDEVRQAIDAQLQGTFNG